MLYEVITRAAGTITPLPILELALYSSDGQTLNQIALKEWISKYDWSDADNSHSHANGFVITSYSIHYTKLYEQTGRA